MYTFSTEFRANRCVLPIMDLAGHTWGCVGHRPAVYSKSQYVVPVNGGLQEGPVKHLVLDVVHGQN